MIVVNQKAKHVHIIFGLLTVAFAAALVRGHLGAQTSTGRVVGDVVFGILFAVCAFMWIWFLRYPARFEIANDVITLVQRRPTRSTQLHRTGDLYIEAVFAPGHEQRMFYLRAVGSDEFLPLVLFDHGEIERACLASGWTFGPAPTN